MTLLETITNRAMETYTGPKSNWAVWRDHWFETANKFYNELQQEGLTLTAKKVNQIILDQLALL